MFTANCNVAGCPGHVMTYGGPEPVPALVAAKSDHFLVPDDDVIYLECDGPEHHWQPYDVPRDPNDNGVLAGAPLPTE